MIFRLNLFQTLWQHSWQIKCPDIERFNLVYVPGCKGHGISVVQRGKWQPLKSISIDLLPSIAGNIRRIILKMLVRRSELENDDAADFLIQYKLNEIPLRPTYTRLYFRYISQGNISVHFYCYL